MLLRNKLTPIADYYKQMTIKKSIVWILLGSVFLSAILSYPAYRYLRSWRAATMARQAETLLDTQETASRAWELAHAAASLKPDDISIARTLATVYSVTAPASAYAYWQKVVALPEHTDEDRLKLAKAFLQAKMWSEFEEELSAQRAEDLHPLSLSYLEAQAAVLRGEIDKGLNMVYSLVQEDDAPTEADTLFFQLTRLYSDPEVRRAGIEHLWNIVAENGPRAEESLETLAQLPDLKEVDIERIIHAIDARENSSRTLHLLALKLRLKFPNTDHTSVYNEAKELFDLSAPKDLATFGRWLNTNRLQGYTKQAVPLDVAKKRQDLFLIHLDAMALDGEWDEIYTLLKEPRLPLEAYLSSFFKARALLETQNIKLAQLEWARAVASAGRSSMKLYYLAQKARQLNLKEFEISTLKKLIELPDIRKRAISELIAALQTQGKTFEMYTNLKKYTELFPSDESALNDRLYIGFLLNSSSGDALDSAKELFQSDPTILATRITLVLGHLRNQQPDEAVKLLDRIPVNWFEVRDRWKLIAGLALHRTGFQADAKKLGASITPTNLLPEERILLDEIIPEGREGS